MSFIEREEDFCNSDRTSGIGVRDMNSKCEHDPLMSNYDFEADGELSEEDIERATIAANRTIHNSSIEVPSGSEFCTNEFLMNNGQLTSKKSACIDKDMEIDEYFNNSGSNYLTQQQMFMGNGSFDLTDNFISQLGPINNVKPRRPLMGVNASALSQNSGLF